MKTLFISAESKSEVNSDKIKEISNKLPKNISIAYSVQFKTAAEDIKKILSKTHKILSFIQVLGCSSPKFPEETQAVLLIGSGRFHGISLAYRLNLPVYILERDKLNKITKEDIENIQKRKKVSYLKFLNSNKIGILISTKPGQNKLKKSLDLKKQLNKKSYLFLSNNINTKEFENFNIDSWVNTACPRLDMDNSAIINIGDIKY